MGEKKHARNVIGLVGWPEHVVPLDKALTEGRCAQERQRAAIEGVWRSLCFSHPEVAEKLRAHGWSIRRSVAWLLATPTASDLSIGELISVGRSAEAEKFMGSVFRERASSITAREDEVGHACCLACRN